MPSNNIKWFRVPWTKNDIAHMYGMAVLSVGVRFIPVFGSIALIEMDFVIAALIVVAGIVGVGIFAFLTIAFNVHVTREVEPLAIGLDDDRIYLDRSLWRYGAKMRSFLRSDLRRLKIVQLPDHLAKKKKSWLNQTFRGYAIATTSVVSFDYQDRELKYLFRHTGIHVQTEGSVELINALALVPGVTFKIEDRTVAREEWLAVFTEAQKHRLESIDQNLLKVEVMNTG